MIGDYKIRNRFKYLLSDKNNLKIYAKEMGVKKMFKFYTINNFPKESNKCQYLIKLLGKIMLGKEIINQCI